MSYQTLKVDLDNGLVRPCGAEALPAKAHALLTLLDISTHPAVSTCAELAERWPSLEKLPLYEARAVADDMELARSNLPPLKPAWD